MGINFVSRFTSMMLKKLDESAINWKLGEFMNFYKEAANITFSIITTILFGEKIHSESKTMRYVTGKNQEEQLSLKEYFSKLSNLALSNRFRLKNIIFPFLISKHWCYPNNILKQNVDCLHKTLQAYFDKADVSDSIYAQVLAEHPELDPQMLLVDIIAIFFAGHDTSSHALCSILFNLAKHRAVYDKAVAELRAAKADLGDAGDEVVTHELIQNCDYLHYVVKESMRIDNPIPTSLAYFARDKIQICGVPIPKGVKMYVAINGLHHDIGQYAEPEKFIPERFDPESESFKAPKSSNPDSR